MASFCKKDWSHREAELNLALDVSPGVMSLRNVNTSSLLGSEGGRGQV